MSNSPTEIRGWRRIGLALLIAAAPSSKAMAAEVHPRVLAVANSEGSVDANFVFSDQSQPLLAPLKAQGDYRMRRRALTAALQARADRDQRKLRAWFDARGIVHHDFWIANLVQAHVPRAALDELATRNDVARIDPNPQIPLRLPSAESAAVASAASLADLVTDVAWGVEKIEAPAVWLAGFTGQGVVIGGEDTGYQWDHPVLKPQYRGSDGTSVDHNFNWHDALHDSTIDFAPCGNDSPVPCDNSGHGTHTAGTFAGDDGASASPRHQTGVAPGARWMGCRNMDKKGTGTPARYIECMQWMLAPTDLNNANANPDLAPDIVTNSWYCSITEGCTTGNEIRGAVDNLVAAGIFYVAAAGNNGNKPGPDGDGCKTIPGPPAIYDSSFVAGATDADDTLADFSSRGPVIDDEVPPVVDSKIRPDLSAPGVSVYSAYPPSTYQYLSGTSMAAPHVAGAAALLMSAFPALKGHPDQVAEILRATATTQGVSNTSGVSQTCGATPITQWPNYMVGYGRVDAWNAYREIIFMDGYED
jgi:subtilisin family serine protease